MDAPIANDTRIGDYRIRGLLGEGAMGQVYLAQDLTLGRRVALKLIRREVMSEAGVERFLAEARLTASFNHPNIVTLHAVGEYEGRPYLALEFVDGESLRARIAAGPIPVREALRTCRAIAEAIAEAHDRGVVHADLKPENVLVRRDGRVRVVDFGLAKLVGTAPAAASGTPAYMAPERWRGDPPSGAIDVWACGMMLAELITGARPIADASLAELAFAKTAPAWVIDRTAAWAPVVDDCLALDPARRPTAVQLVRRLDRLIDPRVELDDAVECPFPGLAAFTRDDAGQYFGRDAELDEAVERLRSNPLVPIVGPSGIGKSSFVHAGLIPRLEDAGWKACVLRPGPSPLAALATGLGAAAGSDVETALRDQPDRLTVMLGAAARASGGKLLVFVDQFEEAFTLAPDHARALCDCIAAAASADEPWRIVLTIRDDFLGRLAESDRLRPHLGALLVLPPLSAADLRTAITRPLGNAGYDTDEPELPARIVADVIGQPACLPLLQFACRELWERRDEHARRLLRREYDAMGGATGALAHHAQALMAELSPAQVRVARGVLLALVDPDGTRRPRLRSQLLEREPDAEPVIDRLLERRLVVSTRATERDEARIELAHEALVTAWPQLARWLDETSEHRTLVLELEQASLQWQRRGKDDDATWGGSALDEAVRRVSEWKVSLPSASRAFLDAGVRRQQRQRRRRRRIVGAVVGTLAVATVVAGIAALAFFRKQQEAVAQQSEIRLAAADTGTFELALAPYDWDFAAQAAMTPAAPVSLRWRLRAVDPTDARLPGRYYAEGPAGDVRRRGAPVVTNGWIVQTVEARSGPAFIEIDRGSACGPSLLALQHLPGYAERSDPPRARFELHVPTCQASGGMVEVAGGPFFRSLETEPPIDEQAEVPAFRIDRTEVTRGAYGMLAAMRPLIGGDNPPASTYYLADAGPAIPMLGTTFYDAREYCRFHGKGLPSADQWQKAFRGGIDVNGAPNPDPHRVTPWLSSASPRPANTKPTSDERDGQPVPVGTFPDDTSPYGVLDMAGNASEWTTSPALEPGLRAVLGGAWTYGPDEHSDRITWHNSRPDAAVWFEIGFRCVDDVR